MLETLRRVFDFVSCTVPRAAPRRRSVQLGLEVLEGRLTPTAILIVNTPADTAPVGDHTAQHALRRAIHEANALKDNVLLFFANGSPMESRAAAALEHKLERIEEAMQAFMVAQGRRPCPADVRIELGTPHFGVEAGAIRVETVNPGIGMPIVPVGEGSLIVAGTIPTKTLQLPDDDAFDGWGPHFLSGVDKRATATSTLKNDPTRNGTGDILIEGSINGPRVGNVLYLLISHGPNGHGAFPAQGSRSNTGSTNPDALNNAAVNSGSSAPR
jgi:hypothetical protein